MKTYTSNFLRTAALGTLLIISSPSKSSLIDNGSYTTDTVSGLDWLDLGQTAGTSYNAIISRVSSTGDLSGWAIATSQQVYGLFDAAGGDGVYPGIDTNGSMIYTTLDSIWANNIHYSGDDIWLHVLDNTPGGITTGVRLTSSGFTNIWNDGFSYPYVTYGNIGTALIRDTTQASIPEPSVIALMGLGIFGLGLARRKMKK